MALVYSFCFWFSLRLGGILITALSIVQASFFVVLCSIAYNNIHQIKEEVELWIDNMNLIYTKDHFKSFVEDPETFLTAAVIVTCFYIITCCLYIYGAYTYTNSLMYGYITVELIRLILISTAIITWLLVLKRNTMDIGLLIGASVACGFLLLGMFYLWICAANLPVLIKEMEAEEQIATIVKLQNLLKAQNPSFQGDGVFLSNDGLHRSEPYALTRN